VEDLISFGLDIGQTDSLGNIPLDYLLGGDFGMLSSPEKPDLISKLLPVGYDINRQDNSFSMTPLMRTIKYCDDNHVKEILKLNPDIYLKDEFGLDAIAYSALYQRFDIMKTLVGLGAKLNQTYPNGETLLHFAVAFESSIVGLYDADMIMYLISNGLSPELENDEGLSPISFAVICKNKDFVNHFYSLGFDINPRLRIQGMVHDRGILSNNYNIYCGKAKYVLKRRMCTPDLLSYAAINGGIDGFKGTYEKSFDEMMKLTSVEEWDLFGAQSVIIKETVDEWSAAQHAAFWGQLDAMHEVEKMCSIKDYDGHESPVSIYSYCLRYS